MIFTTACSFVTPSSVLISSVRAKDATHRCVLLVIPYINIHLPLLEPFSYNRNLRILMLRWKKCTVFSSASKYVPYILPNEVFSIFCRSLVIQVNVYYTFTFIRESMRSIPLFYGILLYAFLLSPWRSQLFTFSDKQENAIFFNRFLIWIQHAILPGSKPYLQ